MSFSLVFLVHPNWRFKIKLKTIEKHIKEKLFENLNIAGASKLRPLRSKDHCPRGQENIQPFPTDGSDSEWSHKEELLESLKFGHTQ